MIVETWAYVVWVRQICRLGLIASVYSWFLGPLWTTLGLLSVDKVERISHLLCRWFVLAITNSTTAVLSAGFHTKWMNKSTLRPQTSAKVNLVWIQTSNPDDLHNWTGNSLFKLIIVLIFLYKYPIGLSRDISQIVEKCPISQNP